MSVTLMTVLFAISAAVIVYVASLLVANAMAARRLRVEERLQNLGDAQQSVLYEESGDPKRLAVVRKVHRKTVRAAGPMMFIKSRLERAHLLYRPGEFIAIWLACGVGVSLAAWLRVRSSHATLLGLLVGLLAPYIWISIRESSQKQLLGNQVGDLLLLLANFLKAGHSLPRAIECVSREMQPPLSTELRRFSREVSMGTPVVAAFLDLERRARDEDLSMAVTAIIVQHEVGGNLAEVLENINYTIRERVRLKGQIRSLTAEGRLSAVILVLLPIVVAGFVYFTNPSYLDPLFLEPIGRILIALSIVGEISGIYLINRIISIEM